MFCYIKEINNIFHIYEKGERYISMRKVKSNREFLDWTGKVLTFPTFGLAAQFCISRNSIVRCESFN